MSEEFSTRDVFEQVDAQLGNIEQDTRGVRSEISGLRSDFENRFDCVHQAIVWRGRWLLSLILASWLSLMASIWLKP